MSMTCWWMHSSVGLACCPVAPMMADCKWGQAGAGGQTQQAGMGSNKAAYSREGGEARSKQQARAAAGAVSQPARQPALP